MSDVVVILCDGCGDVVVEVRGVIPGNDEIAAVWLAHKQEHADLEELLAG